MKLLLVEDDTGLNDACVDVVDDLNTTLEPDDQIDLDTAQTLADAKSKLSSEHYDGVIVDLKLTGDTDVTEGNEILREIVNLKRIPVVVYSAHTPDIDPALETSDFFKVYEKTATDYPTIINELLDLYRTGITEILGRNGFIDKHLSDVFWKHVAPSFSQLREKNITREQLLRYITGHLYEYLEIGDHKSEERYYPEEVYIKPSIKPEPFTGSLMKKTANDNIQIILTPACDIAQGKANKILLADVKPLSDDPIQSLRATVAAEIDETLEAEERESAEIEKAQALERLTKIVSNNGPYKYYFLPPSSSFPGGLINFQNLTSVTRTELSRDYEIIATLNRHFLKDVVAKFSFYYSRQGAPDLNFSVEDLD